MTASRVLFDEPGPRGRRRTRYATALTVLVMAGAVVYAGMKFHQHGQLAADRWRPFTQVAYIKVLWTGLEGTIRVAVVSALVAFPLGAMLAFMRVSRHRAMRLVGGCYVELFRAVPLLLLIYVFLLALPPRGVNLSIFWKLVVPIVMVSSAVLAEVFRAGIRAVDSGQSEAAAAIGLRPGQAMRRVVFPQALRLVVPTLITQFAGLLKDTTLGYVVSYPDLLKQAENLAAFTHLLIQPYLIVAVVYVVVIAAFSQLAGLVERRIGRRRPGPDPAAAMVPLVGRPGLGTGAATAGGGR